MTAKIARAAAAVCLISLILLCLAWELWLAPLRPGGSWLALKALPLLAPLYGVLRGSRYTCKWSSMLILVYFMEGSVRAFTEAGAAGRLALLETALSCVFFAAVIAYVRATRSNAINRAA